MGLSKDEPELWQRCSYCGGAIILSIDGDKYIHVNRTVGYDPHPHEILPLNPRRPQPATVE